MKIIQTKKAPQAIGPYSQALHVGTEDLIFTSGQLGLCPDSGEFISDSTDAQCRQALFNIQAILEKSGLTLKNVVKMTVFLTDIDDFQSVNQIFTEVLLDHKPARSVVQVAALPKKARVEIEAIAAIPS